MEEHSVDNRKTVDRYHSGVPMRRWRNGRRICLKNRKLQVRVLHAVPVLMRACGKERGKLLFFSAHKKITRRQNAPTTSKNLWVLGDNGSTSGLHPAGRDSTSLGSTNLWATSLVVKPSAYIRKNRVRFLGRLPCTRRIWALPLPSKQMKRIRVPPRVPV